MTLSRATDTTSSNPPERLRQLAQVVRQLMPERRRPERFYEEKDAVERELRRLAAELERLPR